MEHMIPRSIQKNYNQTAYHVGTSGVYAAELQQNAATVIGAQCHQP